VAVTAVVQSLSVLLDEPWIGIDRTDAKTTNWLTATATLNPVRLGDAYQWLLTSPGGGYFDPMPGSTDQQAVVGAVAPSVGNDFLGELVSLSAGACSAETNFTIVSVDVQIGVPETSEESPGMVIRFNDNDSDSSETPDHLEAPLAASDPDLVAVQIVVKPDNMPDSEIIKIACSGAGALYTNAMKSGLAASSYPVGELRTKIFYVEGSAAGSVVEIDAIHEPSEARDRAVFHVHEVDLTGPPLFEDDSGLENTLEEYSGGYFVALNDDDDTPTDGNLAWDHKDATGKQADSRIKNMAITSTITTGRVQLSWSPTDQIRIYTNNSNVALSPPVDWGAASLPGLRVEGIRASDGMRAVNLTLTHLDHGALTDEARLTVMSADVDGDSNRDGSVTDEDDELEMGADYGVIVIVNDDDSDANGVKDNLDMTVNGANDLAQMQEILVRKVLPDGIPAGTVLLSGADNVRIFKSDGTLVKPAAGDSASPYDLWSDLPITLKAEGTAAGNSELTVTYRYTRADGQTNELTDTIRMTVLKVDTIDVTSPKSGTSANPPPFPGHTPWPFDVTHSPNPDKHMVVFYKDVVDSSFNVDDFDVTLKANVLPTSITADQLNEVWSKISGPASGSLNRTDTFEIKYQNPKLGGVYRFDFDLGLSGCAKSEANVVLPLAGAEVDSIISADIGRANTFATTVIARYSYIQRQLPSNGLRWFYNNNAGDYLGRPDNANTPTVWVYNQVRTTPGPRLSRSDFFGAGAVGTWKGKPVRVAKISNFMVGYATRRINVNPVGAWMSQVFGTGNDSSATKSWDAGWAIAGGASYDTTVTALVTDIWDEADEKNQKLWPNTSAADDYVAPNSFYDPDHQFTSPGFLYMTNP
jgi:hypothetical protein